MQVNDFNPGIASSGLFWTTQVPDRVLEIRGRSVRLHAENVPVVDDQTFLGGVNNPAIVSFDVTWVSFGKVRHLRPVSDDPTDPKSFAGEFRLAVSTGTFSGTNSVTGFSFTSTGATTDDPDGFAEMGTERNGFFLR